MNGSTNTALSFGDFQIDTDRRLLLRNGDVVPLKAKAFDLLRILVERRGEVLSKNELLDRVWENQFVEENNLTVHVAALRRALGETKNENRYIVTVPGKGYQFVGEAPRETNGAVIVENRKVQRIVVNEEFEETVSDSDEPRPLQPRDAASTLTRYMSPMVGIGLAILVCLGIGGAYAVWSGLGERVSASAPPFVNHELRQLTTNGKVAEAAISPNGKLFAYVLDDVGSKSLWVGNVDGGNHVMLRPPAEASYRSLVFSPDNDQLYFSLSDEKNATRALFSIPVLGGLSTKIKDGVHSFALSHDGRRIASPRSDSENNVVVLSELDGSGSRDLASFPKGESFLFDSISWSPDGNRLAMSVVRPGKINLYDIAIVHVQTGSVSRVPLERYRQATKTTWLNDGSGLIATAVAENSYSSVPQYRLIHVSLADGSASEITADRSNYGESWHNDAGASLSIDAAGQQMIAVEHRQLTNVWVAPADDLGAARQVTFSSFGRYDGLWGMDWTPDGRIVYTTSDTRNQYMATMNGDGSEQKQITDPGADRGHIDSVLTVSADGRYILFHSDRLSGDFDIWRSDIDGSNTKQLTFGGEAYQPYPSPDGKWVYYKSFLNDIGPMCRVPIDGGDPECLTDKETSWTSFSPDGKYIAASYFTDKRRLAIFSAQTHELIRQFDVPKTGTLFMGSRWTADSKAVTYRDTAYGYWNQDIDGGEPRRLEGLPKEKFYNFSWSRDGKSLAFVRGQEIRDVVLFQRSK